MNTKNEHTENVIDEIYESGMKTIAEEAAKISRLGYQPLLFTDKNGDIHVGIKVPTRNEDGFRLLAYGSQEFDHYVKLGF